MAIDSDAVEYEYRNADYTTPAYLTDGVERSLAKLAASGSRDLVEIGCGNGYLAARLAGKGWKVLGLEASGQGVEVARKTYGTSGARFEVASAYDADLRRFGEFDVVLSVEVIEHLQYPKQLLKNAHTLLRPGGLLLLTTPYHGYLKNVAISLVNGWDSHFGVGWDQGHVRFFSPRALSKLTSDAGFTAIAWRGLGRMPGLWKSFLLEARKA